jgi:hypothetical protein
MANGQLTINTNLDSPGLFFKDSNGDLVKAGPVHVGTTAPNATPGAGGQAGNSKGELWLDTSGSDYSLKTWDGTAFRAIVVTSTMIKDGTIVNADVNASAAIALSKLATGALPTAITVASANIVDSTIVNADISATAKIAVSKLANGTARQLLQTAANGTDVEFASNIAIPGTLDVTGAATFDAAVSVGNLSAVVTTKAQHEETQIKQRAAFSVGTPGIIPFGVGPVIPPGMAFFGIGPDAYNPIHVASGSFC